VRWRCSACHHRLRYYRLSSERQQTRKNGHSKDSH
jgi:hypothetical protein